MEICFGSTKMRIFYRENAFHAGKKIRENYFAPSEKYACYAPAQERVHKLMKMSLILGNFFYTVRRRITGCVGTGRPPDM